MDVTCQRCKAEYEFDETLLGDKGTTVKCSSCGHVFRVLPPDRDAGRAPLRLRFANNGSVQSIASLRELQQRIRAGEVGLDDELGRDGHPFRRLRDLPELKNFFQRSPEKTTVRPEASTAAAGRGGPGGRGNTILGNAPTVRPPPPEEEAGGFGEMLEAPTVVAPIPEEIRPRAKRSVPEDDEGDTNRDLARSAAAAGDIAARTAKADKDAKRTMIGVGGALPPLKSPSAAGTLGPPAAAMARGAALSPNVPPGGLQRDDDRETAPKVSAAGTLIGPPAAAIAAREPNPPARQAAVPAVVNREPRVPTALGLPTAPALEAAQYDAPTESAPVSAPRYTPEPPRLMEPSSSSFPPPPGVTAPAKSTVGRPNAGGPVQLYLEEDEVPLERVSRGSSKIWLYLLLLAGLGAGGWYGMNAMRASRAPDPVQPEAVADAAVAEATADAAIDNAAASTAVAGVAEQAPEAPPAKEPAPAKAEPSERESKSRGRGEDSERSASRESQSEPKDYGEWVARGDQLAERNDYEAASKAYESALKLRPTGSEANAGLGFTLLQRGRAREALQHFDRAASSGYAEANVGLGDAYRKLGQTSSALEAYKTYLDRLPSGSRATYVKGQIDRLGRGASGGESSRETAAPAAPTDTSYRPAGELTEPSAPVATPEAPPPSEPAPAAPTETSP